MADDLGAPDCVEACLDAVQNACQARGITAIHLEATSAGTLRAVLQGNARTWELEVKCDDNSLIRLPSIWLRHTDRLLAHVGYGGGVCVSDSQGLSLDPDRRPDIVAFTVLAAYELLEKWSSDDVANNVEFYNELEAYWLSLLGSISTSADVEVDGRDRLLSAFLNAKGSTRKWYFTERGVAPPRGFDVKGLAAQVALYVHLNELVPPPVYPDKLDAHFVEAIRRTLTSTQIELWDKLVRPSQNKNHPKRVVMLVSIPRAAGGNSLIGLEFGTRGGGVDLSAPVTPLTVRRHTATYMRERGGASAPLYGKHVVVVGCGAIGSVIADNLGATGVGRLTLVDYDDYSEDNVFRHILDPLWVGMPKVYGLKYQLKQHYPGINVLPLTVSGQEWLSTADFTDIDAVVFALGLPTLERWFNRALRKLAAKKIPLLFTWLEPLDLGGHSLLVWSEGEGCLDCLYRDDDGSPSLQSRISFLEPNQAISRNLTGCASIFVPYGALQSRRTGLMAAEHLLPAMTAESGPSYRYWAGDGRAASEQKLRTTPWWERARSVAHGEVQTQRAFGRVCKRCRERT